jgi:hypothetical protein
MNYAINAGEEFFLFVFVCVYYFIRRVVVILKHHNHHVVVISKEADVLPLCSCPRGRGGDCGGVVAVGSLCGGNCR